MRYIWSIVGILISIVAVYYFWRFLPIDLPTQIRSHGSAFLLGFLVLLPAYLCRAAKSWLLLKAPGISPIQVSGSLYASIALNNLIPFRAGDVLRLFYLRTVLSIPLPKTVAALLVERFLDLTVILVLFSIAGLGMGTKGVLLLASIMPKVPYWLLIASALAATALVLVGKRFRGRIAPIYRSTLGALNLNRRRALTLIMITFLQWILEIIILGFALSQLVDGVPSYEAVLSSFMCNLSTLIPSAPGYVGTFEVAGTLPFLVLFNNITESHALYVVIYHLIIWTFSTILGLLSAGVIAYRDWTIISSARTLRK